MTGQPRSIDTILADRLKTTQEIAAANTEQLRLNQKAGGMMVLDMKDEEDGIDNPDLQADRARMDAALAHNMERIHRLEAQMAALDDELDAAVKTEES